MGSLRNIIELFIIMQSQSLKKKARRNHQRPPPFLFMFWLIFVVSSMHMMNINVQNVWKIFIIPLSRNISNSHIET